MDSGRVRVASGSAGSYGAGGRVGAGLPEREKSNAEVRSPQTVRRQGVMFGSRTPKRRSMNRMIEVWSKVSEQTQPPVLHGEITVIGTRMPRP